MATGWAHEGAVLDQIHDTITDGVQGARARLPQGDGTEECVECGEEIPQRRREALPGVTTCIACAKKYPRKVDTSGVDLSQASPINRNGFAPKD